MLFNRLQGVFSLLSLSSLATCLPQGTPPPPPPTAVTVKNMTMYGTGCPVGGAGISQTTKGGAPVFTFLEWGLSLPGEEPTPWEYEKWCVEQITLGDGPVGQRLRVASITIAGYALVDPETTVKLTIHTNYGGTAGGAGELVLGADKIKDNQFEATFDTQPTNAWSACVPASGDVPLLSVRVGAGLVGAKRANGTYSGGVLGGNSTQMDRALRINFRPVWEPCPAV